MTTDISVSYRWADPSHQPEPEEFEYDGGNSSSRLYERSRIRALAVERESVQKKTFTKWVNSHLIRADQRIVDLYEDLRDGKKLITLLEILSGEKLPKPTKGKMRIHCLENVDKALQFLLHEQRVHLENLGSHDIVDGNSRLTLGLIWVIILRFQIQDILIEVHDNQETKLAKDALLLWCQMKTAGYHSVNVRNFTSSWRDGLAFNAIIHKHRPDLIQWDKLTKANPVHNLNNAFNIAEREFGLAKLLDPEDVDTDNPDDKSIITYVVTYYHYFSKLKAETVQGKRIAKVVGQAMENDRLIDEYERMTTDLLEWIRQTIERLNERVFTNSLNGVLQQLNEFNQYRNVDKPPKFGEKGNLEILLFTLQSKMRANNQKPYLPNEGKTISDVNRAWENLERAEHERELALREELIRQEKLGQLAARFDRKAGMRESWVSENQRLVSQDNFGNDLIQVQAASKKHEAIETDIFAYEERVQAVKAVANELERENYHDQPRINARRDNVIRLWDYLLELLRNRRARLELSLGLHQSFQEMNDIQNTMDTLKQRLRSDDYGRHLMGVEDLLQKHNLLEADIKTIEERVHKAIEKANDAIAENPQLNNYRPADPKVVNEKINELKVSFDELNKLARFRKNKLEESKRLWHFISDIAEEDAWIREKQNILNTSTIGHDLTTVHLLINKNKALEDDIAKHEPKLKSVIDQGKALVKAKNHGHEEIQARINEFELLCQHLKDLFDARSQRLAQAVDFHQFLTDADDFEALLVDTKILFTSPDYGVDDENSKLLLKKHADTTAEVRGYVQSIAALKEQANNLDEEKRDSPVVKERLQHIEELYEEIQNLAEIRKQRIQDAISLYKLYSEADGVEQWIIEKEKMLDNMVLTRNMEDIEVLKHKFDTFKQEMETNEPRIAFINETSNKLINENHTNSPQIRARQNDLNDKWEHLKTKSSDKQNEIESAHEVQTFHIECKETVTWIEEKTRLLQATEDLGDDLSSIMTLQRRLGSMEKDLTAIKSKLETLDGGANQIKEQHPEEIPLIEEQSKQINQFWQQLMSQLKQKTERLDEVGDLHRFLKDLDHFQDWLQKTQIEVASEDLPDSLPAAENLLVKHNQIKEEIDNYTEDYEHMMKYGSDLTQNQADAQYMFLRERLNALRDGWNELNQMWNNRKQVLTQNLNLQMYLRDVGQVEALLSQQERNLARDDVPTSLEAVEDRIKQHQTFTSTLQANNDKINAICQFANQLIEQGHPDSARIKRKAEQICDRRDSNAKRAQEIAENLRDDLAQRQFAQECDEFKDWIEEKLLTAQQETYRSAKTIRSKWTRHQAFVAEIKANKDRLNKLQEKSANLIQDQPDSRPLVDNKLGDLDSSFNELEKVADEKGQQLLESNRQALYEQTVDDIDSWITNLESQVISEDTGKDLSTVNYILEKQQAIETQMLEKARQVDELHSQAEILERIEPEKKDTIHAKKAVVSERFQKLQAPLEERKNKLLKKKEAYQFRRNVEDEMMWLAEKMPLASSTNYGDSLFSVQTLLKKNHQLANEVDNREPRIKNISDDGLKLIKERHPDSAEFQQLIDGLWAELGRLRAAIGYRESKLLESEKAQKYYYDASEQEAWMSEQELYMLVDDRGKEEFSEFAAQNAIKKHEIVENAVYDYENEIRNLGEVANELIQNQHPESEEIASRQSKVEHAYASLKDLAAERREKLNQALQLCALKTQFDDLLQWIADRELVAGSTSLGEDYEQVSMLRDRFRTFAKDTNTIGTDRVQQTNDAADALINSGNTIDSALIAQYKDNLSEAWADLLEMIETRTQVLKASWELQKYFYDCKDTHSRIVEKEKSMSDEYGRDSASVSNLKRKHALFENDLATIGTSVNTICETSQKLLDGYAGDKANDILNRKNEVVNAWNKLLNMVELRRKKLDETDDLFKFLNMVRDLKVWMEETIRQMNTGEKPRDVSGIETLMNNHSQLRSEIDSRDGSFEQCIQLGRQMLNNNHYASEDIVDKIAQIENTKQAMNIRWQERYDHLQLILEVYQFARDAASAEAWLIAQEPYLLSTELGHSIDEVEQLIKKHEAFENSVAAQEPRFKALTKLTRFEVAEAKKRKLEEERRKREEGKLSSEQRRLEQGLDIETETDASGRERLVQQGSSEEEADTIFEGLLNRKHALESATKKASNRKWEKLYIVIKPGLMLSYKDHKHFIQDSRRTYKGEPALDLRGFEVDVPADYNTKKHNNVFRLRHSATGGEFLFETSNEEEMNNWISKIKLALPGSPSKSTTQTLPARLLEGEKSETKQKRGFFTLKSKK